MSGHESQSTTSQGPQASQSRRTSNTSGSIACSVSPLISPLTAHSTASTITTAASADPNEGHNHRQLVEQLHLNGLASLLATLARLYTELGLHYHRFHFELRFHNLVLPRIQMAMLRSFTSKPNRELPCILQIFGSGEQILQHAWTAFAAADHMQVERLIGVLEGVLVEAAEFVATFGWAIKILDGLAQLCVCNGEARTWKKRQRDKSKMKRRWVKVLPDVCLQFVKQT